MRSAELVRVAQTIACCGEIGGVAGRCEITKGRVWPLLVVIGDPTRDPGAGMVEAEEQALVEKLVAHSAVEALAEPVLHGLAWRDERRFWAVQASMALEVNSVP
jgi:hypothetical protein